MATGEPTWSLSDPESIVRRGEELYAEKYREQFEKEHPGKFVAIDIRTGQAFLGEFPEKALENARTEAPGGIFHLIKVGSPGAFKVAYTISHGLRKRLP